MSDKKKERQREKKQTATCKKQVKDLKGKSQQNEAPIFQLNNKTKL